MAATLSRSDVEARAYALSDAVDPCPDHFANNLDAVIECINSEASLNEVGLEAAIGQMATAARNRIEVDRYTADHPEVEAETVADPIFLTGLPRSGTTYFQYLFDQDPSLRMMRTWEGDRPVPPPALDPASAANRRADSEEWRGKARQATGGKLDSMHLTDVDGPQECLAILDQTFVNPGLLWTMSAPGYLEYLLGGADLEEAYRHHRRVLQLLQIGAPRLRWTLKWPCHLLALQAIASVYPDARFVVTHRDPVQALASNCSLTRLLRSGTSPNSAPERIGHDMLELVRRHVDRLVEFDESQEQGGRSKLVHVDYYRLVEDPASVMHEVFSALGVDWSDQVEGSIRTWRAENPQGKRGRHEYTLEEYGLDRQTVSAAFSSYTERYGIPAEYDRS